jgi:hypothetical protein
MPRAHSLGIFIDNARFSVPIHFTSYVKWVGNQEINPKKIVNVV